MDFDGRRASSNSKTEKESRRAHEDDSSSTSNSSTSEYSTTPRRESLMNTATADVEKQQQRNERPTLERSTTLQRAQSALSTVRSRKPFPAFTHPLTHTKTTEDVVVEFDGPDDPYNPLNWSVKKKVITTVLYGFTTMGATFASSVYSPVVMQISEDFQVSQEVSLLGLSLLLLGFGFGPLVWAPLSELYGRRPAVLIPYFISIIFSFATGAAKDIQTVLITRFFTGFFGAAPITNTGGVLGDIWPPEKRGVAIVGYAMAVTGGPVLGPIVGGAIVQSYLRWRWTQYITGLLMLLILLLDILILDESYPQTLLVYKARRLRHESGNWALHARHEEWDVSLREIAEKYLVRPFQMMFTPICFLIALYASFVYGILYANLAAFPIEFEEERGWNQVVGALPFLAILIGILCGAVINVLNQKYYFRRFKANNYRAVPEARLPPMMVGSVVFASGLFLFAWTSSRTIHWIGPNIGAVLVGFGFFTIFQAALNYLIDTFPKYAASAVAANTFLRSVFAAAFPLFITPMLHKLGIDWGVSVFGFIAVALIPIPYLFFVFGKRIRARGYWSKDSV